LGAVEEALAEAEKHGGRSSEPLAALVAEARGMIEEAKAKQAERARAVAEEADAAAAVKAAAETAAAAKRERLAALALEMQKLQAELGSGSGTPQPGAEETQCVVCMDAPKDRIVLPCMHLCACGPCAQRLLELDASCPVCRGPVERMAQVFS
jgi:hypothetical protein